MAIDGIITHYRNKQFGDTVTSLSGQSSKPTKKTIRCPLDPGQLTKDTVEQCLLVNRDDYFFSEQLFLYFFTFLFSEQSSKQQTLQSHHITPKVASMHSYTGMRVRAGRFEARFVVVIHPAASG